MEITQFLLNAQSPDAKIRTDAESQLTLFQYQNLSGFLLSLSVELSNDLKPVESRRLAGIILKNSLDAKEASQKEILIQQWVAIDTSIKNQIKMLLITTLGSSVGEASHTSAQVIAKISSVELPRKEWPELIQGLLFNMTQQDSKQATLETLGYICEEISTKDLDEGEVNSVLSIVIKEMNVTNTSQEVRLAATRALYYVLRFVKKNFMVVNERDYIMKMIFETAQSKEIETRKAAFECLVFIASAYYRFLVVHIQTIIELTENAVKLDEESVALEAIEFWSSICEVEIELQGNEVPTGEKTSFPHARFIIRYFPTLVPMLVETLLKQDEDQDDGIWNLAMASGTCLELVARTCGDHIFALVMQFVNENISKPDWKARKAATVAFGSILECPIMKKSDNSYLGFLLKATKDANVHVRDTTAWTLSRVFELLHNNSSGYTVVTPENIKQIVTELLESLQDSLQISDKICGAISFLAQGFNDVGPSSSMLTPFLKNIIDALIIASDRIYNGESKLKLAANKALVEVIRSSNLSETSCIIEKLLLFILKSLEGTVQFQNLSISDRKKQEDVQTSLCGVLQVIIQKLSGTDVTKAVILETSDRIMTVILQVLAYQTSTVNEEAMLTVGALAYAMGPDFVKYMEVFYKYLDIGLKNFKEYQVCCVSIGVVMDICRAIQGQILLYCDSIVTHLLNDLSNGELHQSVKPLIFECFGDIALAIKGDFGKYVDFVVPAMQIATGICEHVDESTEEKEKYGYQLRFSILKGYYGILQGLGNSKANLMWPFAPHLMQFINIISKDGSWNKRVTKAVLEVTGVLAYVMGSNTRELFKDIKFCTELIEECQNSKDVQLKVAADCAKEMILKGFDLNV